MSKRSKPDPLSVACPACNAAAGAWCYDELGVPASGWFHWGRKILDRDRRLGRNAADNPAPPPAAPGSPPPPHPPGVVLVRRPPQPTALAVACTKCRAQPDQYCVNEKGKSMYHACHARRCKAMKAKRQADERAEDAAAAGVPVPQAAPAAQAAPAPQAALPAGAGASACQLVFAAFVWFKGQCNNDQAAATMALAYAHLVRPGGGA